MNLWLHGMIFSSPFLLDYQYISDSLTLLRDIRRDGLIFNERVGEL